eukprot:CAMPEP_0113918708 /NCGR_PEP_ID=MMETSP0780_2-20120614/33514_1 /TAXON_ID=652834 /ORGANISM="Palpitomonas bilix" /LENGTH=243 /DNA_ID=CAMNT_0000918571 /DNA_START=304 /DNA_END=1032 /DNA_ORIENTATION=+ /assembly_acc=CAM_ASM_000599
MASTWELAASAAPQNQGSEAGDALRDLNTKVMKLESLVGSGSRDAHALSKAREEGSVCFKKSIESLNRIQPRSELEKLRLDRTKKELDTLSQRFRVAVKACIKKEAEIRSASAQDTRPRKTSGGATPLGEPLLQEDVKVQVSKAGTFELEMQLDKNKELQDLERDVHEIAGLFEEVAVLVKEGGEQIDVIEENVSSANAAAAKGVEELTEAQRLAKKARKKKCFLIICLVVILAIVGGSIGLW